MAPSLVLARWIRRTPITRNPTEAANCNALVGITAEREPPAAAPSRLARTKAAELPANSAPGRLEVPLIVTIAYWVLSPNSAKNTVTNVEARRARSMVGVPINGSESSQEKGFGCEGYDRLAPQPEA